MDKQTVSFRLDSDKLEALDSLAAAVDRNRSDLLNEAVRSYLEIQQWQVEQIKASLRQADAGELIPHSEVKKTAAKWYRR